MAETTQGKWDLIWKENPSLGKLQRKLLRLVLIRNVVRIAHGRNFPCYIDRIRTVFMLEGLKTVEDVTVVSDGLRRLV